MRGGSRVLCPSYRCQDGAILLGIVQADGIVELASERIAIDQTFVDVARQGRPPEKRFRFAGPCEQGNCKQWAEKRCTVIDKVLIDFKKNTSNSELPECSIRPECRWYLQAGAAACGACPEVITDMNAMIMDLVPLGTSRLKVESS